MKKFIVFLVVQLGVFSVSFSDVLVVVHPESPLKSISRSDLKDMFSNKKQRWPHGGKVELVTYKSGAVQDEFCNSFLGKSASQFKQFWRQLVFTGQGASPKEVNSVADMLEAISKDKGAIGFVPADANLSSVKTLTVE